MKVEIVDNILNYWTQCLSNSLSKNLRLNLPGFSTACQLTEMKEVYANKTEEIIHIISKANHPKTSSKSVEKWNKGWGENNKDILSRSPYLNYLYSFIILITFGIGIGFLRNNFKKSIQNEVVSDKPLIAVDKIQKIGEKDIIQEIKKKPSNELNSTIGNSAVKNSFKVEKITKASPSIAEIKNLINVWLLSKSNYLAGKSEINLSKIVSKGLIDRTIEERQNDMKKGIFKEINSQIQRIDLESQTSSRIVVLVELNYLERIIKSSGEFVNETSLTPLKVKYILGFSNKSWKLVDFVSGL